MIGTGYEWTDESIEYLKTQRAAGVKMKDIAEALGCTMGTAAFKVFDLNLPRVTRDVWTPEIIAYLRDNYGKFAPRIVASKIVEQFGCEITVNQVVGKASRLGIQGHGKRRTVDSHGFNEGSTVKTCQYIHGHPGYGEWHFCGDSVVTGKPYCEDHCKACYDPPPVEKTVVRSGKYGWV